ncbi:Glutathione exchanger 1 [Lachancea thermotolerans]
MAKVSSEHEICHIKGSGESEASDCKDTSVGIQTFTTRDDSESPMVSKAGFEATSALLKVKEMEIMSNLLRETDKHLLILSVFICGFGYYLDFVTRSVYTGYATEPFDEHSLLSTVQLFNSVVSIAAQIIFARLSDVYGRLQLFLVGAVLYTIGTIIQSQANGLGTNSVGAIFHNSGFVGVSLLLVLVLSDMSPTAWRLFYQFAPSWPCIIISWVSGDIVEAANPAKNWRLDIGIWAAVFPLLALPFVGFMLYIIHQASTTAEWKELQQEKNFNTVGFLSYTRALGNGLDAFGIALITASLGCILVPLTLAGGASEDWKKPGIIATLVVGVILFMGFLVWEMKCPGNPVLPFSLLRDRGVWATLLSTFLEKMIYAMINDYLYPVLLVSVNESSKSATRIIWLPTFVAGGANSHAGIVGASVVLGPEATTFTQSFIVNLQTMTSHNNMTSITGL